LKIRFAIALGTIVALFAVSLEAVQSRRALKEVENACRRLRVGAHVASGVSSGDEFEADLQRAAELAGTQCPPGTMEKTGLPGGLVREVPLYGFCGCAFVLAACTGQVLAVDVVVCNGFE
jgi:hypothetical protein